MMHNTSASSVGSFVDASDNDEVVLTKFSQLKQEKNLKPLDYRHSFQIVWSNLSYEVEPSTYDKILSGLLDKVRNIASSSVSSGSSSTSSSSSTSKRVIFENLNGYINSGEITAILGPSGAGKTSLLNAICGRTNNYGGRIELIGATAAKDKRMRLSIIPQKDYLIENLTVRENLLYSSRILNVRDNYDHEANIERVAKMLNLTACLDSRAGNISGGEYKRVSIGQELLRQPDILVLDEPTSGLDSLNCKNLIRSLASLIEASRRGQMKPIAILMTIHQPDVDIYNMFDHVYCMARGGRVIFDGHPSDTMQTIRHHVGSLEGTPSQSRQHKGPKQDTGAIDDDDDLSAMLRATTNPANVLIEIASNDTSGHQLIDRLAKVQLEQFGQLMRALASNFSCPLDSGQAVQENQRQANMSLASNESATQANKGTNKLAANSGSSLFSKIKRMDNIEANTNIRQHPLPLPLPVQRHHSLSIASLDSSYGSHLFLTSGAAIYAPESHKSHQRHLVRDKRLNPKFDHSGRFWYHTNVLSQRAFVSVIRDPLLTLVSFLFHLFLPFIMWIVYPKRIGSISACPVIQRDLDMISMVSNRTSAKLEEFQEQFLTTYECSTMFFVTTYAFSLCSLTVSALAFPLNMHILLKEARNGWYQLPPYVLANFLAKLPLEVLFPAASLIMVYLMLGLPSSTWEWRLWSIALVMAVVSMISHTQGLIFGALCMDSVQTAVFLASASTLPQILLSGFTARIRYMPIWLQKTSWLSMYRYSSVLNAMIRFGFGICPCDASTDEYLRTHPPNFKDIPAHMRPFFTSIIMQDIVLDTSHDQPSTTTTIPTTIDTIHSTEYTTETLFGNATALAMELAGSNLTDRAEDFDTTTPSSIVNSTTTAVSSMVSSLLAKSGAQIPGVDYELMLNFSERAEMIERIEAEEIDLFGQIADMMGRVFSYGRKLDSCESVKSQLLVMSDTPADKYLPVMFGCMFALLIVFKIILFLVVRYKIGQRA